MDDFYVVLPSNSKSFSTNNPSQFLTTFDTPINLDNVNNWEVGLAELNFKNTIKTIHNDSIKVYKRQWIDTTANQVFPKFSKFSIMDVIHRKTHVKFNHGQKTEGDSMNMIIGERDNAGNLRFALYYNRDQYKSTMINKSHHNLTVTMPMYFAKIYGFVGGRFDGILNLTEMHTVTINPNDQIETREITVPDAESTNMYAQNFPLSPFVEGQTSVLPKITLTYNKRLYEPLECSVKPKEGTYTNVDSLLSELNKGLRHFTFEYNSHLNRVEIKSMKLVEETILIFENGLHEVLGFDGTIYRGSNEIRRAKYEVNLMRGISTIFMYCDACEQIRVGDTMAPLLRSIVVNNNKYGEMVHTMYINPMYIKVNKTFIDRIEIMLCDATGTLLPLEEGLTTSTLHFKRV